MFNSKKQLEIELSKVKDFEKSNFKLEQYITPSSIAAEILWDAHMDGLLDESFLDLGCGTGIFTIGASMMACDDIKSIEKDKFALDTFMQNINQFDVKGISVHNFDIKDADITKVKLCITNPPFGVKEKGADKLFVEFAMRHADHIYSFHKLSTKTFIEGVIKKHGFEITSEFKYKFPLRNKMSHHKSHLKYIDVICFKYERVL